MLALQAATFDQPDLVPVLSGLDADGLDALDFGVIGFDADGRVVRYNRYESSAAGLSRERVLGQPIFVNIAPCMNNFLVAQRFEDAAVDGRVLDTTLDYVLTLRMKPVKVQLRLLAVPGAACRYVLIERRR